MAVPILLEPVGPADEEFLRGLYATTRTAEMDATGWDEAQVAAFLRMQWDAQHSDYSERYPGADHDIVVTRGDRIGRLWVDRGPEEIRLLDIALLPEFRGLGVGTQLLRGLQDEARRTGSRLAHAVVKNNEGAVRLYTGLGFTTLPDEHPTHFFMEWAPAPAGAD